MIIFNGWYGKDLNSNVAKKHIDHLPITKIVKNKMYIANSRVEVLTFVTISSPLNMSVVLLRYQENNVRIKDLLHTN